MQNALYGRETEKEKVMNKLSMIIGVFFSEVGIEFVKKVSEYDLSLAKYKDDFIIKENYTEDIVKKNILCAVDELEDGENE